MRARRRHVEGPSLTLDVRRTVRLEEVDPLGIMWHGRYPSWFEDGREALGKKYGLHYHDFYACGIVTPVKRLEIDYVQPLHYGQEYVIRTTLNFPEAARMDWEYLILDEKDGSERTVAHSTHLFVNTKGGLVLDPPGFYVDFRERLRNEHVAQAGQSGQSGHTGHCR